MNSDGGLTPRAVLPVDKPLTSRDLRLEVTSDTIIALRTPPSIWPAILIGLVVCLMLSPIAYTMVREIMRRGMSDYALTLSFFIALLLIPAIWAMIATIRRRRLDRGLKLEMGMITVYTPDEAIGMTQFQLADLKDVSIENEQAVALSATFKLVLIRHVGAKVTAFRQMAYDDLKPVAAALYPRLRQKAKGFEVGPIAQEARGEDDRRQDAK
jgi:hypothetical protein